MLLQQSNRSIEFALLGFFEAIPPFAELFGVLDLPTHRPIMPLKQYSVKSMDTALVGSPVEKEISREFHDRDQAKIRRFQQQVSKL